jgi:uncharacterized membrane protein YdfJ with MMPL/SSD domain
MRINPESLARASSRHPWRVIGIWGAVFVAMIVVSGTLLSGVLTSDISFTNTPESIKAQHIIDTEFATNEQGKDTEYVIVHSDSKTVSDPEFQAYVKQVQQALATENADVLAAPPASYYDVQAQSPDAAKGMVSQDQHYLLISVPLNTDEASAVEDIRATLDATTAEGFTTQLAGQAALNADFTKIAEEDARKGESIGSSWSSARSWRPCSRSSWASSRSRSRSASRR